MTRLQLTSVLAVVQLICEVNRQKYFEALDVRRPQTTTSVLLVLRCY